jgi:hypothetical protein
VLQTLRYDPERQRLSLRASFVFGRTVGEDARQLRDFRYPTPVVFLLDFDL